MVCTEEIGKYRRSFNMGREIHSKQENDFGKRNEGIMDIHT